MGIASFSSTGLLGSFQGLVGWLTTGSVSGRHHHASPAVRANGCTNYTAPTSLRTSRPAHTQVAPQRPLRVLRVMDAQQSGVGRMRISGRMADVCAELDRLAALEASPRANALLQ
jgi:hypothetical protein